MKSFGFLLWTAILLVFGGVMLVLFATGYFADDDSALPAETMHVVEAQVAPPQTPSVPTEFVLTDQEGKSFDAQGLQGKIWVGSIFFASCPSTCRMQNQRVQQLQQRYGDKGVEFVSITCDPDNDTVSALSSYAQLFSADPEKWHFLTGDIDLIKRVGNDTFGITVDQQVHSDRLVLFDRDGTKIGSFRSLDAKQFSDLNDALDKLLAEDAEGASDGAGIQPPPEPAEAVPASTANEDAS